MPSIGKFSPSPFVPSTKFFVLLVLHVPLAFIVQQSPRLSTFHAILVLALGIYSVLTGNLAITASIGAYIVGAEVLWRMTDSYVFHEFGKYALTLLFILSLLRQRRFKISVPAILYFALMLPSIAFVVSAYSGSRAREMISFNLAGPMTLMFSILFFSNLKLNRQQVIQVLCAVLPPLIAVATLALYKIASASGLTFATHSALARSGGYAPNQVSAVLGLGAIMAFLVLSVAKKVSWGLRFVLIGVVLWLAAQSSLTYSRAGVINAAISAVLASFFIARQRTSRSNAVFTALLMIIFGGIVLWPKLVELTGGSIITRFTSLDPTGRDLILQSDLQIWQWAFWFGVGPGVSTLIRPLSAMAAAHTEFTRVLAEHGVLGLLSNVMFLVLAMQAWFKAKGEVNKGLASALLFWSIFFMAESATRIVAPSFLFGLAFVLASVQEDDPTDQSAEQLPWAVTRRFDRSKLVMQQQNIRLGPKSDEEIYR